MNTDTELLAMAVSFIKEIGIGIAEDILDDTQCFLPGCSIRGGRIIFDRNKLLYPGDLLHEAGHIAVVPAAERAQLDGAAIAGRQNTEAEEMMAIAWSYAACIHIRIDPHFVFHEHGYKGGGYGIVENFEQGHYIGVPVLQWLGMTTTDKSDGANCYPKMLKLLRD